jgi:hypothetical protein
MTVEKTTTPKQIIDMLQHETGMQFTYPAVHKAKEAILNESSDTQRSHFKQIPDYLAHIAENDPTTIVHIETKDGRFDGCFISPGPARHAFQHCRKFVAMDGTFTKSRFVQCLLIAVCFDADDSIVILAWALVSGESQETWSWFLRHLYRAIPSLNMPNSVVISDPEKGLINALDDVFPRAKHAFCCYHIGANIKNRYGIKMKEMFWKCVYARTKEDFNEKLEAIRAERSEAADYIDRIPHTQWATYAFETPRFSQVTSNLAEITNAFIKPIRELLSLELLAALWNHEMQKFYHRAHEAEDCPGNLSPTAAKYFAGQLDQGRRYLAYPASSTTGFVVVPNSTTNEQRTVTLPTDGIGGACTCGEYQDRLIPCRHACALAIKVQVPPITLVNPVYSLSTWKSTYAKPYVPIIWAGLEESDLLPPDLKKQRGRPKKRRIERGGQPSQSQLICSTCEKPGHNRRTCREAHN